MRTPGLRLVADVAATGDTAPKEMAPAAPNSAAKSPRRVGYADAAAHLGLKANTLRSLVSRGQVPHVRISPRLVVFEIDGAHGLDAWIASKRAGGMP